MKKSLMIIIMCLIMLTYGFALDEETSNGYLKLVEQGDFNHDVYEDFISEHGQDQAYDTLGLFLEARLLLNNFDYASAYTKLETALEGFSDAEATILKAEVLIYLAELDAYFNDLTSAISRAEALKTLSNKIKYDRGSIEADFIIAYVYIYNYDYTQGMAVANNALEHAKRVNYSEGDHQFYEFLGILDYYTENYESSRKNYELAIASVMSVRFDDVINESTLEYKKQLANDHVQQGDPELGLQMNLDLLGQIEPKDEHSLYFVYYSIGDYYQANDDYDKALSHYEQALDHYQAALLPYSASPYYLYLYQSIADVNYQLGNYQVAADYYYDALSYENENYDENVEAMLSNLDYLKYQEINERVGLLEALNEATEKQVSQSRIFIRTMMIGIGVLILAVVIIVFEILEKNKTEKKLYKYSITDSLTQSYNRRKILDIMGENLKKENAVILLDLDNFKDINDTYGHVVGDEVLVKIAGVIKKSIRESDSLGRYGGEEFLIFLNKASQEELRDIAERIRVSIESCQWDVQGLKTTASIGATACFSDDVETVLHEADTLMYQAKNSGKNKIVFG